MSINLGTKIRFMRTIVIDENGRVVRTGVPIVPHPLLKKEDQLLLDNIAKGILRLASVYLHVEREKDNTNNNNNNNNSWNGAKQQYFIQQAELNKIPSKLQTEKQASVLQLIQSIMNQTPRFNEFIYKHSPELK